MTTDIKTRIEAVRSRIFEACQRAGRSEGDVRLVAVSKTITVDVVAQGIEAGLDILGENYIQEAQTKIGALGDRASWHFIGRLQSNKAKYAVKLFDLIHSVDTLKLAQEIDKRAGNLGKVQPVLIQVNISGESTKGGTAADEAAELIDQVRSLKNLDPKGLMTMPPFFDQPDRARPFFSNLREIRDKYASDLTELSMGMSGDFEVAVEEGATLVRVGTAIFGARA
jgi:pyridoxal phosphate enzyme (YggS family)